MKLEPFFSIIGPYLEGAAPLEPTKRALFGNTAPSDADRLAIYERFCREHRNTATGGVHQYLREVVVRDRGEPTWRQLVEDYFRAHPMSHPEINQNGAALATWLASQDTVPAAWSAIADFEWWEWQTLVAPDDPMDATDEGPLRIASTVELRPSAFDVVRWVDVADREGLPEARQSLVIFWRNRSLDARRAHTTQDELTVLKSVSEGLPVARSETVEDLHGAGILVGTLPG